jgi:uncharacterized protein (TIGR03435 family)
MDYFAWRLSPFMDRQVIDQTGLSGEYDFDFQFVEDVGAERAELMAKKGRPLNPHPSVSEALPKQLGLRLEAGKGPVDFIVIDHVERPSAN